MNRPPRRPSHNVPGASRVSVKTEELQSPQGRPARPSRGFLYSKPFLLGLTLLVILLAAFVVYQFTRPMGPVKTWLAIQTVGKQQIVYYLSWNDENGAERGTLESALYAGGALQKSSWSFVGTYNSQTNTLHMVFDKANAANIPFYSADAQIEGETLKLKKTNDMTNVNDTRVFHPASEQDYEQAKQQLVKK
jgi:hypothetical protein